MNRITASFVLLASFTFVAPAHGQTWSQRPGTDYWYTRNAVVQDFASHEAAANGLGAHLAIFETLTEGQWVTSNIGAGNGDWAWFGLYQDTTDPSYSEPADGWKWISGQPISYVNWSPGEPNNLSNANHGLCGHSTFGSAEWAEDSEAHPYEALYEVQSNDCDGNGTPDVCELASGSTTDANSNGIIDACETVLTGLTWTHRPGTDSWYVQTSSYPWEFGRTMASNVGADLTVISDLTEEQWVNAYHINLGGVISWIGLYQDHSSSGFAEPDGGWKWTDPGNNYFSWAPAQPNDWSTGEHHGSMNANGIHDSLDLNHPCILEMQSPDCENNGVPDVYEIALDPSLDADLDGTLDICQGPLSWEEDCNGNGVLDSQDITAGTSTDWNLDGRPDECTPFTSILREHEGVLGNAAFTLAITDDLNGDSIDDYLIAEPSFDLPNAANTGRVSLRSGVDGSLIQEWVSNNNPSYTDLALGFSLDAGGDWDGDGTNDILIGAPGYDGTQAGGTLTGNGAAYIYSGANPSQLLASLYGVQNGQRLGYAVCFLDDSTGDGRDEYATSSPFFTNLFGGLGQVTVYQGGTNNALYTYLGNPGDLYGARLASGGDVDGDGYDDLLIGAPGDDTQGPALLDGRVEVVSGKTGSVIAEVLPVADWMSSTGASLAILDDITGDGRAEFAVGSPRYDLLNGLATRAGKVSVYQYSPGSNGNVSMLFDIKGVEESDLLGIALTRTGDLNGDSISELAVGVPGVRAPMQPMASTPPCAPDVGKVIVFDLVNQRVIREIGGRGENDLFGWVLASGEGDLNGDGSWDLIAGNRVPSGSTYAWICSDLMEILGDYYCEPNELHDADDDGVLEPGCRALIAVSGTTDLAIPGGSLTLTCDYMPIGEFGIFYYGNNTLQVPFGPVGGWRCVGGGVSRLPVLNSGPEGRMLLHIDYANPPTGFTPSALVGQTRHFQCWFRDEPGQSGHFNTSDAVTLTFQ